MVVIHGGTVTAGAAFRALSEFFPADTVVAVAEDGDDPPFAYPEEEVAVVRAVASRRREFRLGRACAHSALRAAGAASLPLVPGPDRAPIWPAGFVGSITHCEGFVGACVARSGDYAGLGFDAEVATALDAELVASVCTPSERSVPFDASKGKILFAAKEAVHKCVAPKSGIMLDFQDVTIDLSEASGTFRARLEPRAPDVPTVSMVEGRYLRTDRLVFALAVLRPRQ
jgi:4'-phosphopantetheinyl transferase EntD